MVTFDEVISVTSEHVTSAEIDFHGIGDFSTRSSSVENLCETVGTQGTLRSLVNEVGSDTILTSIDLGNTSFSLIILVFSHVGRFFAGIGTISTYNAISRTCWCVSGTTNWHTFLSTFNGLVTWLTSLTNRVILRTVSFLISMCGAVKNLLFLALIDQRR